MGRRRKPNKQTHPAGEAGTQPEAAGSQKRAEVCSWTGPSIQLGRGAHRPPASSNRCHPARPTLRRLRSRNLRQGSAPRQGAVGSPRTPRCVRGTLRQRRHAAGAAPPRSSPSRGSPRRPQRCADSGRGRPAPHPEPAAAPRRRHTRPQPRRPRAHLALRGSSLPRPGRRRPALRTPAVAAPHARRATSSQLWAGSGGFRTRRLGAGSREYEPGTQGRSRFFPTRRRPQQQQQRRHHPALLPGRPV